MTITVHQEAPGSPSVFRNIARWWRNWVGNRKAVHELEGFDSNELQRMALDAGVSPHELKALAAKWPDSANLLTRRLSALRIDPLQVSRDQPAVANDLRKLCSLCGTKTQCEHDLDQDPANPAWKQYCPNEQTLAALRDEKVSCQTKAS